MAIQNLNVDLTGWTITQSSNTSLRFQKGKYEINIVYVKKFDYHGKSQYEVIVELYIEDKFCTSRSSKDLEDPVAYTFNKVVKFLEA